MTWVGSKSSDNCPSKKQKKQQEKKAYEKGAGIGVMWPQAKNTWTHHWPEEARNGPLLETLEGAGLSWHFEFEHLVSRTTRG